MHYHSHVSFFFFSSRRRHTRLQGDWSSDVCSSDLPLFAGLSRWEARKVVLLGGLHEYEAGAPVIVKGEIGTEMYMVVTGRIRVFDPLPDGRERTLTALGPCGVIGEIGVLTQQVRSASAGADARPELL